MKNAGRAVAISVSVFLFLVAVCYLKFPSVHVKGLKSFILRDLEPQQNATETYNKTARRWPGADTSARSNETVANTSDPSFSIKTWLTLNNPMKFPDARRGAGSYEWVLSPHGLDSGIANKGYSTRLRVAMEKYLNGQPLRVAVVGGSVTQGVRIKTGIPWVSWIDNYLRDHYGNNLEVVNAAVSGTKSTYLNACPEQRIPQAVDLIIVEYAYNDKSLAEEGGDQYMIRSFERTLRKLLTWPTKPAVMLLHVVSWKSEDKMVNWNTSLETGYNELAEYYQLPAVSMRACCFHVLVEGKAPGFWTEPVIDANNTVRHHLKNVSFFADSGHLDGGTGQRVAAELVLHTLNNVIADVKARPVTSLERQATTEALPDPMVKGNYESGASRCFVNDTMLPLIVAKPGFEWINEKPSLPGGKWGMIATKPGSYLELVVDSSPAGGAANVNASSKLQTPILLSFLRSYKHMGRIKITCRRGCTCNSTVIDGHTRDKTSLVHFERFEVSQHPQCLLRFTVLKETSSGEHKFKVMGIIVTESALDMQWTYNLGKFVFGSGRQ